MFTLAVVCFAVLLIAIPISTWTWRRRVDRHRSEALYPMTDPLTPPSEISADAKWPWR